MGLRWLDMAMLTNFLNKTTCSKFNISYTYRFSYITFTTSSYVKHRILHVMRDADAISDVKTGKINADVLTADVIRKYNF